MKFVDIYSTNSNLYSRVDISRAETRIKMTRKRGATTANQAFTPLNMLKHELFWTRPPPLGILNIPRNEFIDIDEAGVQLGLANRTQGKSFCGVRVRSSGPYSRSEKWTLILAIGYTGLKHFRFSQDPGTTAQIWVDFIRGLLARIQPGTRITFLWDNLISHFSAEAMLLIHQSGHRVVARPPYRPEDGPIEYVFNQYESGLRLKLYSIHTSEDLVRETHQILANIGGIQQTFHHCGY